MTATGSMGSILRAAVLSFRTSELWRIRLRSGGERIRIFYRGIRSANPHCLYRGDDVGPDLWLTT